MKSLELIKKLNEDPALRDADGIRAGRLADRIRTLIELGKLDRDALVYFENAAINVGRLLKTTGSLWRYLMFFEGG